MLMKLFVKKFEKLNINTIFKPVTRLSVCPSVLTLSETIKATKGFGMQMEPRPL